MHNVKVTLVFFLQEKVTVHNNAASYPKLEQKLAYSNHHIFHSKNINEIGLGC